MEQSHLTEFLLFFFKLLVAHLISDYFLQFTSWVHDKDIRKIKSTKLYYHIAVTFLAAGLITGQWLVAFFIALSHLAIDLTKIYFGKKDLKSFIIDQSAHLIVLIISALYLSGYTNEFADLKTTLFSNLAFWIYAFSYLLVTFPLGVVIGIATRKWFVEVKEKDTESLSQAGLWIGILERILILTFIFTNQFTAISFLITAKAILRLKDDLKKSEYVLIGTLISFTITILVGLAANYLINL